MQQRAVGIGERGGGLALTARPCENEFVFDAADDDDDIMGSLSMCVQ